MLDTSPSRAEAAGLRPLAIGIVRVAIAFPLRSPPLLFVGTLLVGTGHGLGFLGALAAVSQLAPDEHRADVTSSLYVLTYLGVSLPVIGVGFPASWFSRELAVYSFAGITAAAALIAMPLAIPKQSRGHIPGGLTRPGDLGRCCDRGHQASSASRSANRCR